MKLKVRLIDIMEKVDGKVVQVKMGNVIAQR